MRRLYFLRENEEDGAVLDALTSQGLDPNQLENPTCPRCGRELLPAYVTEEQFRVVTWFCLTDADEEAAADEWYLVCGSFACGYEEPVERVWRPKGATIFDIGESFDAFEGETGLTSCSPDDLQRLLCYLQELDAVRPSRKLRSFIAEIDRRREHCMEQIRRWLEQVPGGQWVEFSLGGRRVHGTLVVATEAGFLLRTAPDELLVVGAGALRSFGPRFFGADAEISPDELSGESHAILAAPSDYIVIRGHHLLLGEVDRLGRYRVRCWDGAAARDLNLRPITAGYWEGEFRRSQIDGRYQRQRLLLVSGHWVECCGETEVEGLLAVQTTDTEVARALGFKPMRSWGQWDIPPSQRTICCWYGYVRADQVEAEKELHRYSWPILEADGTSR